jgi:integrase
MASLENLDRVQHQSRNTRLSAQTVEAFRSPPKGTRLEVSDSGCPGLRLRVSNHGDKAWSVVYRVRGEAPDGRGRGNPRRASLGSFPHVDLATARDLARAALDEADRGVDYAKRLAAEAERQRALATTGGKSPGCVEVVVDSYIETHLKEAWSSWQNADRWLRNVVAVEWAGREITSIRRRDVVDLLDKVSRERTAAAVIEVRKHLNGLINWAIASDKYELGASPMFGIKRKEKYVPRDNTLTRPELRRVWDAAGEMGYPFREMFRLLMLTGQRRSEVAEIQTSWLFTRDDGAGRGVRVPAAAYKTGKTHEYPLSKPAVIIVDTLPKREDRERPYLLSGTHTKSPVGKAPVSGFSKAKARLDRIISEQTEKARKEGIDLPPMPAFTVHDIRRSVATGMAELGVSVEHIERVLGHELGGVASIYNRHDYFAEKLAALELWGKQFA